MSYQINWTAYNTDGNAFVYKSTACFSQLHRWGGQYSNLDGTPSHIVYERRTDLKELDHDLLPYTYETFFDIPMFRAMMVGDLDSFMETKEVRVNLDFSQQLVMQLLSYLRIAEDTPQTARAVGWFKQQGCSSPCALFLGSRYGMFGKDGEIRKHNWDDHTGHDPMSYSWLPASAFKQRMAELMAAEDTATLLGKYTECKRYSGVQAWWTRDNPRPDRLPGEGYGAYRKRNQCILAALPDIITPEQLQATYEELTA